MEDKPEKYGTKNDTAWSCESKLIYALELYPLSQKVTGQAEKKSM